MSFKNSSVKIQMEDIKLVKKFENYNSFWACAWWFSSHKTNSSWPWETYFSLILQTKLNYDKLDISQSALCLCLSHLPSTKPGRAPDSKIFPELLKMSSSNSYQDTYLVGPSMSFVTFFKWKYFVAFKLVDITFKVNASFRLINCWPRFLSLFWSHLRLSSSKGRSWEDVRAI